MWKFNTPTQLKVTYQTTKIAWAAQPDSLESQTPTHESADSNVRASESPKSQPQNSEIRDASKQARFGT